MLWLCRCCCVLLVCVVCGIAVGIIVYVGCRVVVIVVCAYVVGVWYDDDVSVVVLLSLLSVMLVICVRRVLLSSVRIALPLVLTLLSSVL